MRENYDGYRYPGKFEGNGTPMVEFVWQKSLDGMLDTTGSVESPEGFVILDGKWLVWENDQGFVSGSKFPTTDTARASFNEIDTAYAEWENDDGQWPWKTVERIVANME